MTNPGNKTTNRWLDVQIVIATLGMTLSLFLWNVFTGGSTAVNAKSVTTVQEDTTPTEQPTSEPTSQPVATVYKPFSRILLGGSAPPQSSNQPADQSSGSVTGKNSAGSTVSTGNTGSSAPAPEPKSPPAPVANTSSS